MGNENVYRYFLWALAKKYWQAKGNGELNSENLNEFNQDNDLSILKLAKLSFLVYAYAVKTNSKKNEILDAFLDFEAWPYGPVSVPFYQYMKKTENLLFSGEESSEPVACTITSLTFINIPIDLPDNDKNTIDCALQSIVTKNNQLLTYKASVLVNLTHKWDIWNNAFNSARKEGRKAELIKKDDIISGEGFWN